MSVVGRRGTEARSSTSARGSRVIGPVLLVVDSLQTGGGERHAADLAIALHCRGVAVTVACSAGGFLAAEIGREGIEVCVLGRQFVKRRLGLRLAWRLRRLVHERHVQLVHAHMYAGGAAGALALLGSGVPLVRTEHSEANWRGRWARLIGRLAYRRTAHIIAVSGPIRQRLVARDGVPAERVTVIPCAMPEDRSPQRSPVLPEKLRGRPLVGVVARLQPEKGVEVLLRAASRIVDGLPECAFVVVGDGPLRATLEAQAARLGLGDHVHFLGFRPDARALLSLLDVLVAPSVSEGAPLVILEAMAAGVPVVASSVGGIPDQIRHEEEGLLVPPGNHAALAAAVLCLLEDPALARRYGEAGRRKVEQEFRYEEMVEQIEGIYRRVSLRHRPPSCPVPSSLRDRGCG